VVLGVIGIATLPIEQYPDVAPPTVQVEATYPGASAEVLMNSVIVPLEEQINGVEGMTYMTSMAMNSGNSQIKIFFKQGINPDIAAVNVQNLVARATPLLPAEVTQIGVTVAKQQNSTILGISLSSQNPDYDGQFLQNYANINILPQIKRVYGVGQASVNGAKDYSMRIWLKPDVMASYKISSQEVIAALQDQNIEAAPGELGANSDQSFQYALKYTGKLKTAEQFGNVIIRSQDGQILRVKDIANVELASLNYSITSMTNKTEESVFISISQTAGSNAQEVIENVKVVLNDAEKALPPGVKFNYLMDSSEFLDESIKKVLTTFLEAFILVFIVVFVFLQDMRSTIIPAIAVPVAIIGTFFFLQLFGFSINLLTLFALILAIGIVVDDAIVVVEAVHAQLDAGEKDSRVATINAMKEIAPAIISITLVMAAVFVPVSFIGGTSGIFFRQFGLTLAISILISAVNALTLSPALCALFLKPHDEHEEKKGFIQRFYRNFNMLFNVGTQKYKKSLHFLGKKGHRWITGAIIIIASFILIFLIRLIPTGFVPNEDSGSVIAIISLPPGSSLERSDSIVGEVVDMAMDIEGIENVTNITGINFMSGLGSSYGTIIIKMIPWGQRKITTDEVTAILGEKTKHIQNATFFFMAMPTLQGFGLGAGVEVQLQDRLGGDVNEFYDITRNFVGKLNEREEIMYAVTNFNPTFPQKQIEANIPKIKEAGLTLNEVMGTLQSFIGSSYISTFNLYGKQFRVMAQAGPEYRKKLDDLNGIFVQTGNGEMAPITEFITISDLTAPQMLTRFNMYQSMDMIIVPNMVDGYSTGDVLNIIQEMAGDKIILPDGYSFEYAGLTREEANSSSQIVIIFGICLIFVYLLLAALYESYILPFSVLLSLPIGMAGVFLFLMLFGVSYGIVNNIYVQIAMIMLIGLLAKNAILIVEYAIQRRQQGMSIIEAAVNGAVARLRPILMTSFAFIFGLLPLAIATGAGATGNRSIGISAVGGMFIGTMIGILVIPTLYIIFQSLQERFSGKNPKSNNKNLTEE